MAVASSRRSDRFLQEAVDLALVEGVVDDQRVVLEDRLRLTVVENGLVVVALTESAVALGHELVRAHTRDRLFDLDGVEVGLELLSATGERIAKDRLGAAQPCVRFLVRGIEQQCLGVVLTRLLDVIAVEGLLGEPDELLGESSLTLDPDLDHLRALLGGHL